MELTLPWDKLAKIALPEATDLEDYEAFRGLPTNANTTVPEPVGLLGQIRGQLEYELNLGTEETKPVNKVAVSLINILGFGLFGVDRCCMGQVCCGVIKGLTLGGVFVWFLIDYWAILINCLTEEKSLTWIGFNAKFEKDTIATAMWVTIILFTLKVCSSFAKAKAATNGEARAKKQGGNESLEESNLDYATLAA